MKRGPSPSLSAAREQLNKRIALSPPQTPKESHQAPDLLYPQASVDSFPVFDSGNVYIRSELVSPPECWKLHSTILARNSSWLATSLKVAFEENYGSIPKSTSYTLREANGKVELVPECQRSERLQISPIEQHNATTLASIRDLRQSSLPIARSTRIRSPKDTVIIKKPVSSAPFYNQLFGAFYGIVPEISPTNINTALLQSEELVNIANALGCSITQTPSLISDHINNALLQHRQALFIAVKGDPARWLKLSISLQNTSIYTESLIHLVGAHPCWPWPTNRNTLPETIHSLIRNKSKELDQLYLEAERDLLILTINVHRGPVQPQDNGTFDTWFVVQLFRDNLARALHALSLDEDKSLKRGTLIRKIKKGGSAYVDFEETRRLCEDIMPSTLSNLGEDLKLLKEYASKIVEDLARNELLLDPDIHEVGYLTCTKVRSEDRPWK